MNPSLLDGFSAGQFSQIIGRGQLSFPSRTVSVLVVAVFIMWMLNLSAGSFWFVWRDWSSLFLGHLSRLDSEIFWQLRFPRALSIVVVGASLGVAGCGIQGLLQNPLADPALLGVSSGSSFFVVLAMILLPWVGVFFLPLFALLGSAISLALILWVARGTKAMGFGGIVLGGVALNALFGSAISLLYVFANRFSLSQALMWTLGGVQVHSYMVILVCASATLLGAMLLVSQARSLDKLSLGFENAYYLGVNWCSVKWFIIVGVAIIVASTVVLAGPIAFVGLLVPHACRLLVGVSHQRLMFCSAWMGALLLLLADLIARTLLEPLILPLGVVMALVGAPGFLLLLWRSLSKAREVVND